MSECVGLQSGQLSIRSRWVRAHVHLSCLCLHVRLRRTCGCGCMRTARHWGHASLPRPRSTKKTAGEQEVGSLRLCDHDVGDVVSILNSQRRCIPASACSLCAHILIAEKFCQHLATSVERLQPGANDSACRPGICSRSPGTQITPSTQKSTTGTVLCSSVF